MLKKHTLWLATTLGLLGLSGCGGSDSNGGDTNPPLPPPPQNSFKVEENSHQVTAATVSAIESLLQLGYLTEELPEKTYSKSGVEAPCSNGGLMTTYFSDEDANGHLSNGDTFKYVLNECFFESVQSVISGEIVKTTTDIEANSRIYKLDLRNAELSTVNGIITIPAVLHITQENTSLSHHIKVSTTQSTSVQVDGEEQLRIKDFSTDRIVDFNSARYQISANGSIHLTPLGGDFTFSLPTTLSGHLGEYPNSGLLNMQTSSDDKVELEANYVENSSMYNQIVNTQTQTRPWLDIAEGTVWVFNNQYEYDPIEFSNNNFQALGLLTENTSALATDGIIEILFSREIASHAPISISEREWPYREIPVITVLNGATVTITPESSLTPGALYSINYFDVTSVYGISTNFPSTTFTVSNNVIPKITATSSAYRDGDYPVLDASDSTLTIGEVINYQWEELSNLGVTFSNASSSATEVTVPAGTDSNLKIKLTVTNELGDRASTELTIKHLPTVDSALLLNSPKGDYIGAGQDYILTSENTLFSPRSSYITDNRHASIYFDGSTSWNLDLVAPEGKVLAPGLYKNAQRFPFQASLNPGLDFSGEGRGCNRLSGSFEVYEVSFDNNGVVNKLAANFSQSCEETNPALKGIIRFNSQIKLNHAPNQ